ncbi:UNVERIFIED_CONTAM: hypothetical protein Slati_3567500 [Sesamum latifolium]|uniref:DUF1308 domain-containing protein n=1 Tax=Sesamum latifolium TaxID=2727402 RepID=A0AAW2UPR0_9LAMI
MEERESVAVEDAKRRCVALTDRLQRISKPKLSSSPKTTLFRLIHSELTFLHRLSATFHPSPPLSSNIGHLEAVVHKPRYISWDAGASDKNKGLKKKIQQVIDAARESPVTLKPSSVVLFFSNGLDDNVYQKVRCKYGAVDLKLEPFSYEELELEDNWTNVVLGRLFPGACVVQIEVDQDVRGMEKNIPEPARMDGHISCKKCHVCSDFHLGTSLQSLVSGMKCWCCSLDNVELDVGYLKQSWRDVKDKLVNFDTTAMVAVVSGISNGRTAKLLATPESELRGRFKGNYDFVIAQELVAMCGGPNEKLRAESFLKFLKVVPDCPSTRLMSLPTTRKLALKNKVVFGTGDYWYAPTITANMAFVRAVSQTGMSLSVIEHRPRALIGD